MKRMRRQEQVVSGGSSRDALETTTSVALLPSPLLAKEDGCRSERQIWWQEACVSLTADRSTQGGTNQGGVIRCAGTVVVWLKTTRGRIGVTTGGGHGSESHNRRIPAGNPSPFIPSTLIPTTTFSRDTLFLFPTPLRASSCLPGKTAQLPTWGSFAHLGGHSLLGSRLTPRG